MTLQTRDGADAASRWRTILAIAGLAILAAVYFGWPAWRAQFPLEIDVDEPWNGFNARRLISGLPLYPDPQGLITNNYPPLSFLAIAGLSWLGFDVIEAGRVLSLAATATTALSIGICVRLLGGGWLAGSLAGLWFLATASRFFDNYVGKDDPHLPATALMVLALAWFLRRIGRGRAAEPAILLMVVAGFYKHTLLATPATALLWLAATNRRLGVRATLVGAGTAVAGLLLCVAIFGVNFIGQMLFVREYSVMWALGGLGQLQWIAPALLICMVWWWYDRDSAAARFTRMYAALAFLVQFAQKFGQGVGINAQFELMVATAIGIGCAFEQIASIPALRRLGPDTGRALLIGVLIVRLLISSRLESYLVVASPAFRAGFYENSQVAAHEVARVRAIERPVVICSIQTVCLRAGKPFLYDAFAQWQRMRVGGVPIAEGIARLSAQGIPMSSFEQIDPRASVEVLYRRF